MKVEEILVGKTRVSPESIIIAWDTLSVKRIERKGKCMEKREEEVRKGIKTET